jgi:hypothetical protein
MRRSIMLLAVIPTRSAAMPLASGQARVFVLRDKVLYLAQGPGIGRPEVAVDGQVIGSLENGGFLMSVPISTMTCAN